MSRIPLPLTAADRAARDWWELSMRQVEVSRTLVFGAPRHARAFFEALVADNLDLGRPEHVELLFKRSPRGRKPKDPAGGVFKTAIDRSNQGVTINAFWRRSRVKQYLKDGQALRIETVVNSPDDLGCARRLHNLPELQARARAINTRLLETEKVGQGCVFDSPAFARISSPPSPVMAGGPQDYGSATLESWPWPASSPTHCAPSPASPTRACAP